MASFPGWEQQLLAELGAPVTPNTLNFLRAWQRAEGGTAAFNPLNTTLSAPGATAYNSVGVRDYPSANEGIRATAQTLQGPYRNYAEIVEGLRRNLDAGKLASLVAGSPWGTGGGVARVLGSGVGSSGVSSSYTPAQPAARVQAPPVAPAPAAPIQASASSAEPESSSSLGLLALISGNQQAAGLPSLNPLLLSLATQPSTQPATIPTPTPPTPPKPQPQPQRKTLAAAPPKIKVQGNVTSRVQGAVKLVQEYLGTPYVWGGQNPGGFDCSGLLQYVWGKVGVQIPRTTYDQINAGRPVPRSQLQPGDAVFFTGHDPYGRKGAGHVGMYLGGGKFIEAPGSGKTVRISNLADRSDYVAGRRFA